MKFEGKIWTFGDDIDTDVIISGKYLRGEDPSVWGQHVFEVLGDYSQKIQKGDIIVGGNNFGCGSSREQAAIAVKESGASVIVAKSFGRIFFRNCINIGMPVIVCPTIDEYPLNDGDFMQVDVDTNCVIFKKHKLPIQSIPDFMQEILNEGGLINYYNMKNP
jgi:methanogen homoaconitase small subunit